MADGDLYLSDSPNVDKGFVEQDGQLRGVKLQAVPDGTLELSNSANVSTGYVTDTDGKKHKVNLVAEVEGTLELPESPNSDTGYVVDGDGKKHKVQLSATLYGGGSAPVIDELNVTPSTSAQTITATGGTDGYSPVNVAAVTSSIDANIVAGNIKKDVQILGVTGSYEGTAPSGTKLITTNGVHDVAGYASADVQVPGVGPNVAIVKSGNNFSFGTIDLQGITEISQNSLFMQADYDHRYTYAEGDAFKNAESLTVISGQEVFLNTFRGSTGLTSVNLPNLTTVSGQSVFYGAFYGCTGLTSVNLPNLTTVSGQGSFQQTFYGCTNLKSIYLPKITSNSYNSRPSVPVFNPFQSSGLEICDLRNLETVGDYGLFDNMINGTASLKKVNVNALTSIGTEGARAFLFLSPTTSSSLTDLYFPMLTTFGTNPFYTNAFLGREGLTIHFRKDAQATVEALANYATLWGAGTGSSVVFDLAGTLTGADSNAYTRAEKYSVYASETAGAAKTATAWRYNNTTYYTAGDSEPQVGDTIYSDSACTTAVTTISSIA